MKMLEQRIKDNCFSNFGKAKLLNACFGIIPSFASFLDYLCCLGESIIIFIKNREFAKPRVLIKF